MNELGYGRHSTRAEQDKADYEGRHRETDTTTPEQEAPDAR